MTRTIRRLAGAVLVMALLGSLTACGSKSASPGGSTGTTEPYKIGAILSLTGTYAGLGAPEKNTIELEEQRINDAGGINGRKIEVIIKDDGTDEAKAVAAVTELIDQEGVIAILGATGTGQSMAIRGDIDRAGVPQISMAGGNAITANFDKLVYQTPWTNSIVVPFVLRRILADGYTKIAVMSDTGGYGKDGLAIINDVAPALGLQIVSAQTFNPGDTDMSAQLTNIRGTDAQALLLWTAGKEAAIIAKNREQLDIELPWYGGSGQARKEFVTGGGAATEGFIFGTGKSLVPSTWGAGTDEYDVVSDFSQRYEAKFGQKPDIFAGHAFDAMNILVDALKRAGDDPDAAAVNTAIEGTKDLVGFGGVFTYSSSDHNGLTSDDLSLYLVKGGEWVPLP